MEQTCGRLMDQELKPSQLTFLPRKTAVTFDLLFFFLVVQIFQTAVMPHAMFSRCRVNLSYGRMEERPI